MVLESKYGFLHWCQLYVSIIASNLWPWTVYNGHADVTALIDGSGILASYYYDAFGNITENMGDINNPYKYAGYQYDDETGVYYLNARYYDPKIARFLSEDTYTGKHEDPLSLNLYTYCHNEPLMYSDPTGHFDCGATNDDDAPDSDSPTRDGDGNLIDSDGNIVGSYYSDSEGNIIDVLNDGGDDRSDNSNEGLETKTDDDEKKKKKTAEEIKYDSVLGTGIEVAGTVELLSYEGTKEANTFSIQSEPKNNRLIIVGLPGPDGRLFELAANTYKTEHPNDDVKIIYAKDYNSMDELLDASSKAFDKGFWGNIIDNNEIDDLVYYGHSYSPGEDLDHGGLSVFYKSGRNDSWITKNSDLSKLDFNDGATIHLYGCDGGTGGPKGENSIAQDLANKTGAIAYGYTSKSSFTSDPVLGHGQRNISDKEKLSRSVKGKNVWLVPNNDQPMTKFTPEKPWYQFW